MDHFEKIENGFINIFFPETGSNKGWQMVEHKNKNEKTIYIYMYIYIYIYINIIIILKYNIPPYPNPWCGNKFLHTAFFISKHKFDAFYDFYKKWERFPARVRTIGNICCFSMIFIKINYKRGDTISTAGAFYKEMYEPSVFKNEKSSFYEK